MSTLIAITYDQADSAETALNTLMDLQKEHVIELEDAAVAVKDQKGQTLEKANTGASAVWGGFWGLLIGLIFLSPIFWAVIGALMGALFSKAADLGIDNKFIKEVGNSLEPGGSALFLLVRQATPDKVLPELQKVGNGHVFQTSLSQDDEDKLRQALEHDQVRDAAEDSLDLEDAPAVS
jgi:uncharacterized membrane protein